MGTVLPDGRVSDVGLVGFVVFVRWQCLFLVLGISDWLSRDRASWWLIIYAAVWKCLCLFGGFVFKLLSFSILTLYNVCLLLI